MEVHFVAPDLWRFDGVNSEALSLPFFEDERPLRGALGLVDWRMCGLISRLIRRGRISGARGEKVLIPIRPRLTFEKLFLFGLGPQHGFDTSVFDETADRMLETLRRARLRASAMALPGRSLDLIEPEEAMERFLAAAREHPDYDEVTLVEDPEAQKAIGPVLERARRRARADVL